MISFLIPWVFVGCIRIMLDYSDFQQDERIKNEPVLDLLIVHMIISLFVCLGLIA